MKKISRRDFLKTTVIAGGAAALAACAPAATPTAAPTAVPVVPTTAPVVPTTPPANLPFTIAPGAANPFKLANTTVDGVFFAGGYGDDYIKYAASMMEMAYPGMKVGVQSTQRVGDVLRPRFVGFRSKCNNRRKKRMGEKERRGKRVGGTYRRKKEAGEGGKAQQVGKQSAISRKSGGILAKGEVLGSERRGQKEGKSRG